MSFTTSTSKSFTASLTAVIFLAVLSNQAWACHACGYSAGCCTAWQSVEVEQEYVVKVPYQEEVERTVMVSVPHVEQVEHKYTVMVPHSETRQRTRTIRKSIPETKTVSVSRDFGRWETHFSEVLCAPCECECRCHCDCVPSCHHAVACTCPEPVCSRMWVPDVRTKEIAVTTYKTVAEEIPYEHTVTVHRPEQRTRNVDVVRYTTEERKQKVMVTRYREETRIRKVCVLQPICECCVPVCHQCE